MDDEIERIRQDAEMAAAWDDLNRKTMELGERHPEKILWDKVTDEMADKHIKCALKHECFLYVKRLEEHKAKLRAERIRQFIRGERDDY